jgi:ABC-type transport system involved in multi-copper enzyme maturation permease subunit
MLAWELIKETFFRKSSIAILHVLGALLYGIIAVLPMRNSLEVGAFVFILSGVALPLLISQGIFGDDIVSGRARVVLTKPMSFATLYIWRLVGMCLQCLVQMAIGSAVLYLAHRLGARGSVNHLLLLNLMAMFMFLTLTTLSTSVSSVVKGGLNLLVMVFGLIFFKAVDWLMGGMETPLAEGVQAFIKYALPPLDLLWSAGNQGAGPLEVLGLVVHALALSLIYASAGIIILSRREFACEREC